MEAYDRFCKGEKVGVCGGYRGRGCCNGGGVLSKVLIDFEISLAFYVLQIQPK